MQKPSGVKKPTQNPVDFFKGKPHGGAHGKPSPVNPMLSGGPMREKGLPGTRNK